MPSLFSSKWKRCQPCLHKEQAKPYPDARTPRCPSQPWEMLGRVTSQPMAVVWTASFKQRPHLISASWRRPSIGLLTSIGDGNKPPAQPVHVHATSATATLASSLAQLSLFGWHPGFLIEAGAIIPCVPVQHLARPVHSSATGL